MSYFFLFFFFLLLALHVRLFVAVFSMMTATNFSFFFVLLKNLAINSANPSF